MNTSKFPVSVDFFGTMIPFNPNPGMQQQLKKETGSIEYKGRIISGKIKDGAFVPDTLNECGCCSHYHQNTFTGDCRDDRYRFPSWELNELTEDEGAEHEHHYGNMPK